MRFLHCAFLPLLGRCLLLPEGPRSKPCLRTRSAELLDTVPDPDDRKWLCDFIDECSVRASLEQPEQLTTAAVRETSSVSNVPKIQRQPRGVAPLTQRIRPERRSPPPRPPPVERRRQRSVEPIPYSDTDEEFWPDMDKFKDMLREETRWRIDATGGWAAPAVNAEASWRLRLYKWWLDSIAEGIGEPLFEDDAGRPLDLANPPPTRRFRRGRKKRRGKELPKSGGDREYRYLEAPDANYVDRAGNTGSEGVEWAYFEREMSEVAISATEEVAGKLEEWKIGRRDRETRLVADEVRVRERDRELARRKEFDWWAR